ncbi:hypothetical protein ACIRJS_45170 [Streptomyces sp. NPDC102340]|uniref:hypothetical protein n=1 Tax=Streptomyces sp. NPDC102340 TaxID=3366156 RepID=UPI0037F7D72E
MSSGDLLRLAVPGAGFDTVPDGLSTSPPASDTQMSLLEPPAHQTPDALWVSELLERDTTLTATTADAEVFHLTIRPVPQRRGSDQFRT